MPIEVLGQGLADAPTTKSVALAVDKTAQERATYLYFRCHRCGFYGAPEYETLSSPLTETKASVRIAEGAWVDITDANVTLDTPSAAHGGVAGAHRTVKIWLALTDTQKAALSDRTSFEFRFNGTDGKTTGFRIIDINLHDASKNALLTPDFGWVDPAEEKNTAYDDAAAKRGEALWKQRNRLEKSTVVNKTIKAACADCHTPGGRDLQYFNYSNAAIVERSKFHGLSEQDANDIVAFIRNMSREKVPHIETAAPWNPPYQPGPGLDCFDAHCASNEGWSAGAGLDAVLDTTAEALHELFGAPDGRPITQADVDKVMQIADDINLREMRVPLQFPDWNDWLPEIHPMDIWTGELVAGYPYDPAYTWENANFRKTLDNILTTLDQNHLDTDPQWKSLSQGVRERLNQDMHDFGFQHRNWLKGLRGSYYRQGASEAAGRILETRRDLNTTKTSAEGTPYSRESFMERANEASHKWKITQMWWINEEYDLASHQNIMKAHRPERRGWNWNTNGLFYAAPHINYVGQRPDGTKIGDTFDNYTWNDGNRIVDYIASTQWYQLQLTLNSGARNKIINYPMDWGYHHLYTRIAFNHITDPAHSDVAATHMVRHLIGRIKMAQYVDNDRPLYKAPDGQPLSGYWTEGWGQQNSIRGGREQLQAGFWTQAMLPWKAADVTAPYERLNVFSDGIYAKILNGYLKLHNSLYNHLPIADWPRCAPYNTALSDAAQPFDPNMTFWGVYNLQCADSERRLPRIASNGAYFINHNTSADTRARRSLYALFYLEGKTGIETERLAAFRNWVNAMWPE